MKNLWKGISWLIVLVAALTMLSVTAVAEAEPGLPDVAAQESPVSVLTVNALKPIVTETGKISLSLDGLGSNMASGIIQVEKPAGATVRKAYMAAASMGTSGGYIIPNGGITIDGVGVLWDSTKTMSCQLGWSPSCYNHWADITSMVKPKIDAAAPGRVSFTITEGSTSRIDGEILAVIFDDPSQTTDNTVILLYGAQSYAGDTFAITLAEPIDKTDPNLKMDFSLGISYGYQGSGQYSRVDINSNRLTTSAGGQDDGSAANGALLTVGGLDDSNANPPNPYATPAGNPRIDDELYNLLPFVNSGDTAITVYTLNPSTDDNIFFAALNIRSAVAIVGEGIVLAPLSDENPVGSQHTLTATVKDDLGRPVVGRLVTFRVVSGPHAGLTGTGTTDANGHATFTYTGISAGTDTIEASFVNSQGATQPSNRVTKNWVVTNNPPVANPGGPYSCDEGSACNFDGSASYDLDAGDYIVSYEWDLDNDGIFEASGVTVSKAWPDDYSGSVTLRVTDTYGATDTASAAVTVSNVAPSVDAGADQTANEGDSVSFSGTYTDPAGALDAPYTIAWDFGDGTGDSGTLSPSHVYADNGVYTVTLTVTDNDGGMGTDTMTVTVNNVAPSVGPITVAPVDPVSVGTAITATASFTDPGTADAHTAEWNWGDGTSAGTVTETSGSGSVTDSHTYATPGIYTVTLTVTDDDGGADSSTYQFVVVYDPNGGFVTGGGWINSPAGAYVPDPSLIGKANFGFVSKYLKGANVPTGVTEFQFKAGNLNFHSKNYEWLVVAGARAQYKGTGTINGAGEYGFMLTAIDGQINGGGGVDKFRIKIWDRATDTVVYDNVLGASDDVDAASLQAIAGGSIVIHNSG